MYWELELDPVHLLADEVGRKVGVDHRDLQIRVPKDLRQRQERAAAHHEVRGERVPQQMPGAGIRTAAGLGEQRR